MKTNLPTNKLKFVLFPVLLLILGYVPLQAQSNFVELQSFGFIENNGQLHDQYGQPADHVHFLWASARGLNVQLRESGLSYDTYHSVKPQDIPFYLNPSPSAKKFKFQRIDLDLVGANKNSSITAANPAADKINFYQSLKDSEGFTSSHYQEVTYSDIYPGIDLVCQVDQLRGGNFKYDFVVDAGADLSQVKLRYSGYTEVKFDKDEISFILDEGELSESIPASWFLPTKSDAKVQYRLLEQNEHSITVGLELEGERNNQKLVVDPEPFLHWSIAFGDSLVDYGTAVTQNLGFSYFVGNTQMMMNIATADSTVSYDSTATYNIEYGGGEFDGFLTRRSYAGFRVFSTYIGGAGDDFLEGVDAKNHEITIAGNTNGSEGLATDTSFMSSPVGGSDCFVAKLDTLGQVKWSSYLGGTNEDTLTACAMDTLGNVFISGVTNSPDLFSLASESPTIDYSGGQDGFIAKFDTAGQVVWSTYFGGPEDDYIDDIYVDSLLNLYACGHSFSTEGIATEGAHQIDLAGNQDAFFAKFDTTGTQVWGTYFGGDSLDVATGITSISGEAHATGYTRSVNGIVDAEIPDSLYTEHSGQDDAFVVVLDTLGLVKWSKYIGGAENDRAYAIARDRAKSIYLAGGTESEYGLFQFPNAIQQIFGGASDAFIMKLDSIGDQVWSTYYGGDSIDVATHIDVYGFTVVYFTGHTNSPESMHGGAGDWLEFGGNTDVLMGKFIQKESTPADGISGGYSGSGGSGSGGGGNYGGSNDPVDQINLCLGDTMYLSTVGGATGYGSKWMWYADGCGAEGGGTLVDTGNVATISPDTTTTYFVRAEGLEDLSSCTDITVHVVESPTTEIAQMDTLCPGDSLVLDATGEGWFEWTGPNDFASEDSVPVIDTLVPGHEGWFHVMLTNAPNCFDTDSAYLNLLEFEAFEWEADPVSCWGESDGEISVSTLTEDSLMISWGDSTLSGSQLNGLEAGGYLLHVENLIGCFVEDSIYVNNPPSYLDSLIIDPTTCGLDNGGATLQFVNPNEEYEIEWSSGNSDSASTSGLVAGVHQVMITDSEDCTEFVEFEIPDSDTLLVNVTETIDALCNGGESGSAEITVQNAVSPMEVQAQGGFFETFDDTTAVLEGFAAGEYNVIVTDSLGCVAETNFEIGQPDSLSYNPHTTPDFCSEGSGGVTMLSSGGTAPHSYYWPATGDTTNSLTNLEAGSYQFVITDSLGCQLADAVVIPNEGVLDVQISPQDPMISIGDSVQIQVTTNPEVESLLYLWEPATGLSCDDCPNPLAFPEETTSYDLLVITPDGCENEAQLTVNIEVRCNDVFVPTVFSPNGDGRNDHLKVYNNCIEEMDFAVFNRWGEVVFETNDPNGEWDGTFRGEELNSDNLVYSLRAVLLDGTVVEKSGNVRIHR